MRDRGGVRFWFDAAGGLVARVLACGLWRGGGEAGEGLAAPLAGFRREPGGTAAGGLGLAGVPGGEDVGRPPFSGQLNWR